MRLAHLAANISVSVKNNIAQGMGYNFLQHLMKVRVVLGEIWKPFQILNDFAIHQNTCRRFMISDPGSDNLYCFCSFMEKTSKKRRIKQVPFHNAKGGLGLLSCRIRS